MALRRLLALIAAVALVVGAIVIRRTLDGDPVVELPDDGTELVCDRAIADACRAVFGAEVRLEDPGDTLDRLASGTTSVRWITERVWAENLAAARQRTADVSVSDPIAASPLVLVAVRGADTACGDVLTWACLADGADGATLGIQDVDTTVGLHVRGQLAAGWFGSPAFASNDLGADYARFESDLDRRVRAVGALDPLGALFNGAGAYTVVAVTEASWLDLGRSDAAAVTPADTSRVLEIVAVEVGTARIRSSEADDLGDELRSRNWTSPTDVDDPRPTAGVLEALRRRN